MLEQIGIEGICCTRKKGYKCMKACK